VTLAARLTGHALEVPPFLRRKGATTLLWVVRR
jgi:hypothetical protein